MHFAFAQEQGFVCTKELKIMVEIISKVFNGKSHSDEIQFKL